MNKHAVHWIKGLAKYGIGFGLLGYMLSKYWAPRGSFPGIQGLLEVAPDVLALCALCVVAVVCTAIQFVRWYILARALDLPVTVGTAFRLGLVGGFFNAFMPGSVGGDLVKAYYIAKGQPGRRASAVATVIADRLVGLFGLIWFSAVFGGAFWIAGDTRISDNGYLKGIVRVCGLIAGTTVLGWALLRLLPQHRADRLASRLSKVRKIGHTLAEVWYAVWTYRQRPRAIYTTIAMTAVVHVGFVVMFHLAVRVYPVPSPGSFPEHFVVAPIGYIAQAFFPTPGGLGGGEAIFAYLYTLLDRPEETGGWGRFTMRVFAEWSIGLAGLVVFLKMRDELPAVEDEAEKEGFGGHEDPPPTDTPIETGHTGDVVSPNAAGVASVGNLAPRAIS